MLHISISHSFITYGARRRRRWLERLSDRRLNGGVVGRLCGGRWAGSVAAVRCGTAMTGRPGRKREGLETHWALFSTARGGPLKVNGAQKNNALTRVLVC
jgi:hypothetical protein